MKIGLFSKKSVAMMLLLAFLLLIVGLGMVPLQPVQPQPGISSGLLQVGSPTPMPTPTPFSPQVIREGRPIGIIIGTLAILFIILASTIPSLICDSKSKNISSK